MKKNYLILGIVALIILVAILTNPNTDRHKETIKNKVTLIMQKNLAESEEELSETEQALGAAFFSSLVNNLVSTDNYVLFSTTKMSWGGETEVIGIGAFGNVFLTNRLDKAVDEGLLEK